VSTGATAAPSARRNPRAIAAWVAVCVVWGTTYLAIRVALESLPVALLAGMRWTAAGLVLAVAARFLGYRLPPLRTWGRVTFVAFLMNVMGNGLVVWAEQYVASGLAAVFIAMTPFWSVFIDGARGRGERFTGRIAAGLLLGFSGILTLVWPELTADRSGSGFILGAAAVQLACAAWALGTSITKHDDDATHPLAASALQMLLGGVILLAIGTVAGEWARVVFTSRSVWALVYLTAIGSLVGYSSYVYALRHLPVSFVSLYAYVNPIIAVGLGWLVLSEPLTIRVIGASALVLAGIWVVNRGS
jgi:drug/metabolite transporter (DMT)-like permease